MSSPTVVVALLVVTLVVGNAFAEDVEPAESRIQVFVQEVEQELARRKDQAERVAEVFEIVRQELTDEYRNHSKRLLELKDFNDQPDEQNRLMRRQKLIGLYLWELEQIEPRVSARSIACEDIETKVRNEIRAGRGNQHTAEEQERLSNLYEEVMRNRHGRREHRLDDVTRRRQGLFYEVTPVASAKAKQDDATADEPGGQHGVLNELRRPIQRLVKLTWRGNKLDLDREHWGDLFVGKSLDDVRQGVRRLFENHGAELLLGEEHRHRRVEAGIGVECLLFQNLMYAASEASASRSMSRSGGGCRNSFRTDEVDIAVRSQDNAIEINIREVQPPERSLHLLSRRDGMLRIHLIGDGILYMEQRPDGKFRVLDAYQDVLLHATGKSFMEVYRQHPGFFEQHIFPLLDQFGMLTPTTRFSPSIVEGLIAMFQSDGSEATERFPELLVKLDSESFIVRERAQSELEMHANAYHGLLKAALRDTRLSLEARSRIKSIMGSVESEKTQVDTLIQQMGLATDKAYLVNLLSAAEPEYTALITHRLEQLTGEELGEDVAAWQAWLANDRPSE